MHSSHSCVSLNAAPHATEFFLFVPHTLDCVGINSLGYPCGSALLKECTGSASQGLTPSRLFVQCHCSSATLRCYAGDPERCDGLSKLASGRWARLKSEERAIEKALRSYRGDVSRLVDICRLCCSTAERRWPG